MPCQFVFELIEAVMVRKGLHKEYRPQALSKSLWSGKGADICVMKGSVCRD